MPAESPRYRFGPHELDLATMRLTRDGQPLKLPSRALLLLAHLVERRHRVVPKAELLELSAPQRETDAADLARHVSVLRRLLGEDAVATAPGRGWRFVRALHEDTPATLHLKPTRMPESAHAGALPGEPQRLPARPLFGREADLAALAAMLPERRLMSLVGREGVGKTQLVAQLVAHRPGVVWVDLSHLAAASGAALASPEWLRAALAHAVARALGARHRAADPLADLTHALRLLDVPSLWLVFDETSQCPLPREALAELVQALLDASPALRVMWVGAHALELGGESLYRLHGLQPPAAADEGAADPRQHDDLALAAAARESPGLRVLLAQARRSDPQYLLDFADAATCRAAVALLHELEGLPMALELAGARLPALGPERLLQELRHHRAQRAERSASRGTLLHAVMDWTLARLTSDERALLRQACTLLDHAGTLPGSRGGDDTGARGSFALDDLRAPGTAGAAAVADTLDALIDLGLVQLAPGAVVEDDRFRVLGPWRQWARRLT